MPRTRGRGAIPSSGRSSKGTGESSNPNRRKGKELAREEDLEKEALEVAKITLIKEEGINSTTLQDTPIPEKIKELGWEKFVLPHGDINMNWVGLVHASDDIISITNPRRGITIRGKKVVITPQAVNEYYGTPFLYGTATHPRGFPTDVALDQYFSSTFLQTLRKYPLSYKERGRTQCNHRELSAPDAFWNIFIRKTILPCARNQEPNDDNLRVLYSIHTGQRFDLGVVICDWLKECLKQSSISRIIFPSLITYFCSKAGVPQKTSDIIIGNGLMLDQITWNRALNHRPEGAREAEGYPPRNPTKSRKRSEASSSKQPDPLVQPQRVYMAEDQHAALMGTYASTENRMISQHEDSGHRMDNMEANLKAYMESFFTPHFDRIYAQMDSLQTQISNLSIQTSPPSHAQIDTGSTPPDQNDDFEEPVHRPFEPGLHSIPMLDNLSPVTSTDADAILTGSDNPSDQEL